MKTKPILLVIITLVIGFILGMLTSAQIRFNKLKPLRLYFSEERFREGFYKTIQPDEKQKAEIEKILDKYAKINSELQSNFRKELDSDMKELRKELDAKLTKEQQARLKEIDDQRQNMIRQNRRNHNDSSDYRNMRNRNRNGRPFPDDRQMPPRERPPFPRQDTNKLPDNK
jgi:deoxyribodipyrimidine photolyase-like uncharacterized protein